MYKREESRRIIEIIPEMSGAEELRRRIDLTEAFLIIIGRYDKSPREDGGK